MDLQVMTFNVRNGTAPDGENGWDFRKGFAGDVIRETMPDVLGLQEAFRFQLDDLATQLPEYTETGIGRAGGSDGEYAAILFLTERFSIDTAGTFWLSETPDEPSMGWGANYHRICSWARLMEKCSGHCFYVYNVHLDHQVREAQVNGTELLLRRIAGRAHKDPVVLIGDFNIDEDDELIAYVKGDVALRSVPPFRLMDTFRVLHPDASDACTYHGFGRGLTGRRIDYIFSSPGTRVLSGTVIRTQRYGRFPSDHYPVTASLRLTPGSEEG